MPAANVELQLINSTERVVNIYFVHRNGEELIGDVQPGATSTVHTFLGQHFVYRDAQNQELVGKTTARSRKQKYVIRKSSKSNATPGELEVSRKRDKAEDGPDPVIPESEPAEKKQAVKESKAGGADVSKPSEAKRVTYSNYAHQILSLVNSARQSKGYKPVKLDPLLCQACLGHCRDMIQYKFFSHRSLAPGKTQFWERAMLLGTQARSENIAKGQPSPQMVMNAWMKSSGHRNNILDPSVKRMGVGWVGMYWTQMFGY